MSLFRHFESPKGPASAHTPFLPAKSSKFVSLKGPFPHKTSSKGPLGAFCIIKRPLFSIKRPLVFIKRPLKRPLFFSKGPSFSSKGPSFYQKAPLSHQKAHLTSSKGPFLPCKKYLFLIGLEPHASILRGGLTCQLGHTWTH